MILIEVLAHEYFFLLPGDSGFYFPSFLSSCRTELKRTGDGDGDGDERKV